MFPAIWDLGYLYPTLTKRSYSPFDESYYSITYTITDPVELWYIYRVSLILTTCLALLLLRVFCHLRPEKKKPIDCQIVRPTTGTEAKELLHVNKVTTQVNVPRRIVGVRKISRFSHKINIRCQKIQVLVFFSSLTGTTEKTARLFTENLAKSSKKLQGPDTGLILPPKLLNLSYVDFDDYFLNSPKCDIETRYFYLILIPTYNIDTILDTFIEHLKETHNDFRVDNAPLSPILGYSVFGFGDKEGWPTENEGFCFQARQVDKWMAKLTGGKRAFPLGIGDIKRDAKKILRDWEEGIYDILKHIMTTGNLGEGIGGSGDAEESDIEGSDEDTRFIDKLNPIPQKPKIKEKSSNHDLEDIGTSLNVDSTKTSPQEIDFTAYASKTTSTVKEMVPENSPTFAALTKQGYTIVGSHSGVKICRWTKSALRGRGSCYKYSFYGIASHQCMETTPSLSCSNKCVFCWRHGTNPVGTTWRWLVDPPELIFNGVKAGHYQKIKMMRGVPGVRAERFAEAMHIRHCALSLVGEPIFYPHINEFISMLHAEHISSFLVCNAQHPDQLASLKTVTQLYVSIDASNRESLRKVDRPLHRDFWERFNHCLDIIRKRRFEQRTVFRLTLVKGFNLEDETIGYADLIEKSLPCFIEVKGVTYCGTSSAAGGVTLTMENVPFYEEVCTFVESLDLELRKRKLSYGIAAEHAHSCCALIASERFKLNGKWHTLIDYAKFFSCLESGKKFKPEDYMGSETPEWATWGKGGFDPRDERVYRKGKNKLPLSNHKLELEK